MGRSPIGKTAMSGAERVRRHRRKQGLGKPVTKPAVPPRAGGDHAALAQELAQELAQAKARIAELEAFVLLIAEGAFVLLKAKGQK